MSTQRSGARVEPAPPSEELGESAPPVLFLMRSLGPLRYFQSSLEALVDRGHAVRLVLEHPASGPAEQRWLEGMLGRGDFGVEMLATRRDPWRKRRMRLRAALEYVHFRRPGFREHERYMRASLRRSPPLVVRAAATLPALRSQSGLRLLYRMLAALERAIPQPPAVEAIVERLSPRVVVVADVGYRQSRSAAFIRTARRAGIPTMICVASWDNLTTRPPMHEQPDVVGVWNEQQRREAVELYGVPADRVVVTGAPNFDQWFEWRPRPAEEFFARVGLDPERPMILWVCSALNRWERPEPVFFLKWLEAVRSSPDAVVRGASVLLRPHPLRRDEWRDVDLSALEGVAMWPRTDAGMPIDPDQKADYFDSIFHSRAVVGINTSAMIEASIVGRPVLTVLEPAHHDSQFGAVHFRYLVELGGGLLRVAPSLREHVEDLAPLLCDAGAAQAEARRFVEEFVRPNGLARPATPIIVEAIESAAAMDVAPVGDPRWLPALRHVVVALYPPEPRLVKPRWAVRHPVRAARIVVRKLAGATLPAG